MVEQLFSSDVDFHALDHELIIRSSKVADCSALPELLAYAIVLSLDRELREIEAEAPDWLHCRESDPDFSENHHQIRANQIPQQPMARPLLHTRHS